MEKPENIEWQAVPSTLNDPNGKTEQVLLYRAKVPGGWFVKIYFDGVAAFFYPDAEHKWDGRNA